MASRLPSISSSILVGDVPSGRLLLIPSSSMSSGSEIRLLTRSGATLRFLKSSSISSGSPLLFTGGFRSGVPILVSELSLFESSNSLSSASCMSSSAGFGLPAILSGLDGNLSGPANVSCSPWPDWGADSVLTSFTTSGASIMLSPISTTLASNLSLALLSRCWPASLFVNSSSMRSRQI